MITQLGQLDLNKHYTYADYILWQFQERVELLKGRLFPMSVPNVKHQRISSKLHIKLGVFLMEEHCDIFHVPFDVRLPLPQSQITGDKIDTVVQPDLCVICDESKLDKQGCVGAPDLVIEILSPGNSKKEMKKKYELYEEAGVMEYWVIDPEHQYALLFTYNSDTQKFTPHPPLTDEDTLESHIIEGLKVDLGDVFPKS